MALGAGDFEAAELLAGLRVLRAAQKAAPYPAYAVRRRWLAALGDLLRAEQDNLCAAASADFGHRSPHDTLLGDVWVTQKQLAYVQDHLLSWMEAKPSPTPLTLAPGSSRVLSQPRGVVLVIAPWNYPVMLALTPLIAALAAGNRVVLKLSEHTPRTSQLLATALRQRLGPDVVLPVLGGVEAGRAVTQLDVDLILYTGSTAVGREVARAAAERLIPVVLELGGKSPAILGPDYPLETFVRRVLQGKCFNAGQTCVAPDYLLVPRGRVPSLLQAFEREFARRFPSILHNPDYTAVASERRASRLRQLHDEAVTQGARSLVLNPANEEVWSGTKLPLTLLWDVPAECVLLQEELFGPLLPIVEYTDLDEALHYVAERPQPLALYYFDLDSTRRERVLRETQSGGVTLNDTLMHFIADPLPRGGVGASGMGAYQGEAGFLTFSHQKPIFDQARLAGTGLLNPPYRGISNWVTRFLLRLGR